MSKLIHDPALARIDDNGPHSSTFVVEPLHASYGNTLGNSLRRVLLSSIRGGAFTAFRMQGATHEFTTVPGAKEDVTDIMLNLKGVDLVVHSDEPVELRLEKQGAGAVTAGDIAANAEVEVVNPEHIICTIDDPQANVVIDLVAEAGRGYYPIEESSANRLHSDMIAMDAQFSPVTRVRFKVDPTRVGQETNLERLEMTVETDGSLTPRDAFEQTAEEDNALNTSIEDLGLSARTANALINNEIRTVHDLVTLTEQDLRELKGFGSKALDEVKDKLAELEL